MTDQLIGENSALERQICRRAQRSRSTTLSCFCFVFFLLMLLLCNSPSTHFQSPARGTFLTSASMLFCLLFDLLFSPLCPVLLCNMLTLAQLTQVNSMDF